MADHAGQGQSRIRLVPPSRHDTGSDLPAKMIRETRRTLRLPDSGPIVATGHAPVNWHPGILAKFMAMRAVARDTEATPVVLTIDTVAATPGRIEVPWVDPDGLPCSSTIQLFETIPDRPLGMQPATDPADLDWPEGLMGSQQEALQRYITALQATGGDVALATQVMRALMDLSRRWIGRPTVVSASRLLQTSCGRWLMERMQRDARRCVEAYNAAVSVDPDAGIPLLDADAGELPLWDVRGDGRRTARRQDLDDASLLPKALVITAILRLAGCDLFIHGTGGARYDALMEGWIRQWLGLEVAPFMVVTADMQLPLPDVEAIARVGQELVACGRRAYHDPESVDEAAEPVPAPGPRKRAALSTIESAPRGSDARREAYASMHETLATMRSKPADVPGRIADRVREARRTAGRRDWDFIFYPEDVLDTLDEEVDTVVSDAVR
ncbi:MAG: hypothetical protein MK116_01505 [Phycisphaerales bacterium]|nr:hypothetical protein [Phycisphaerales bacterium]